MTFRLDPVLPPAAFKSYRVLAPVATHFRPATCAEVDCPHYLAGWRSVFDERTGLGQRQAHFVRHDAERRHFEERLPDGTTAFTFPPGQRCFNSAEHRTRLDIAERFLVTGGDYRGNPLRTRPVEHTRPELWQEDFAEHQDKIATAIERG